MTLSLSDHPVHPRGLRARVLLCSVFGPYARDDEYGSRTINPMELYHNQVTRLQGAFSLRMFHRSFGLMMIQANIDAPCTLLDFPSRERFIAEIRERPYDIIGISSILTNIGKVREMCRLIREHQPGATIVVGGHIAAKEDIRDRIDADHICRGEGIRWFRRFLGQDENGPIRHPMVYSGFGVRILGVTLPLRPGNTAAMLIPSVGCPVGCNFCSTSALFGGKGHSVHFYETGDALFDVMDRIEKTLDVRSFFVMDENFLLHRNRALRLLERMKESGRSWSLYVFSSARVLRSYSMEELVGLGISWVWMGLEGEDNAYHKLRNVNTMELVKTLQSHGIRVLGSSIIGLEHHTPENMERVIDYAVAHDTDFHQFMLYTPIPGTPLHKEHTEDGTLLPEDAFPIADGHGQYRFNYRHRHIPGGMEEKYLLEAFRRDFEVNGPSLARLIRTFLQGWKRYGNHPDRRIRDRFAWEVKPLRTVYAGAVWAMRKWYEKDDRMRGKMDALLKDLYRTFGWVTRAAAPVTGRYLFETMKREEARLARGWTWEPETFFEKNEAALALDQAVPSPARRGEKKIPVPAMGLSPASK
jgi:radical SAM superfamily enzyme YgiQ (UPF0313 family)